MLEGLVAWVLNNYLGKYVENLNTDQLSIAILSGEVELENLPLRRDALRHLGIPVEIRAGHIGKIKLQIPIRALRSSPWVIVIERLYLVAGPLALDEWDQAAEELAEQERKLAALDAIEACWRLEADGTVTSGAIGTGGTTYYASSYSSWLSYGTGVITDIVENMQLHVKDVHIRYEDATSLPGGGACACGLTIESLSAQSCDSLWQPQFTSHRDGTDLSFKTIELRNLAVYWDTVDPRTDHGLTAKLPPNELTAALMNSAEEHRFLVAPVSACARLQRNRNELPLRSAATPRIVCDLNLDQVPLTLVDWQYEQMVCCIRGLEFLSRVQQQRRQRPSVTISTDPKSWWLYAIGCHVPSVSRHRTCARTWSDCLDLAKQNVQYVDMYTRYLAQPSAALGSDVKRLKDTVEWSRDFEELRALREVAMRRVSLSTTPIFCPPAPITPSNTNTNTSSSSHGRSVLVRWFPQWWGWYSTPSKTENTNDLYTTTTTTTTTPIGATGRQLEDEILEALADSAKNNTLLRRDVVFGKFNFTLNGGTFELCASNEIGAPGVAMIELQFTELEAGIVSRPRSSSHGLQLRLGSLCLRDRLTAGTLFPVLVGPPGTRDSRPGPGFTPIHANVPRGQRCRPHHSIRTPGSVSGGNKNCATDFDEGGPLFSLFYEAVGSGVCRLHVRSRPIDVVYQPAVARWLVEFACAPHQRSAARHRLEEMRARTKQQLTDTWGSMLDGHQHQQRTTWDLRFDVSAPQLILVERFCDPSAAIAVVDLGTLHLENGYQQQNGQQENYFPPHPHQANQKQSLDEEEEDDDAFMTPCSTPPGSEAGDDSIGDKVSVLTSGETGETTTLVSALSELSLHQKLYDTYNVELCDIQVLVGRVRDNWRHAHTKGSSSLHVLDRFNIALQVERRIVPTSDPMYPSVTLAANLPRLVAHVNEQKISALRTLARVISDTSLPSPFNAASPAHHEPSATPRPLSTPQSEDFPSISTPRATSPADNDNDDDISSNSNSSSSSSEPYRLLTVQFTVDQMSLEVQSRGRSVAELQVSGVTAALHRRPFDLSISLTVHGLLLVDALQTFGPDFELLVASHRHVGMDSMSGSLRDSEPTSPTSPGSPDPGSTPRQQPRATSPIALTRALSAVVSPQPPLPPLLHAVDSEALISVEFVIVTGKGKEEAIQLATIQFNNLDIIANQETIVELVGFLRRVSPVHHHNRSLPPQSQPFISSNYIIDDVSSKSRERTMSSASKSDDIDGITGSNRNAKQTTRTELTFDFHRLNVLLLRGTIEDGRSVGRKIGTATMCEARIQATVDSALFVRGSLGGLQVLDLTPEGHLHQRIISVGRDPLADETVTGFNFNTLGVQDKHNSAPLVDTDQTAFSFSVRRDLHCLNDDQTVESNSNSNSNSNTPEPVVDVSIRMASVWYTHSPQFLSELRSCATEFKQYLADVARSIRSAATDVALGLVHARTEALAHSLYMNPRLAGLAAYDVQSPRRLRRRSTSTSTSEPHTPFTPYAEDDGEDNSTFGETDVQLDIVLDSPVLVLPRSSESCHVLVGHLGKITVNNTSYVEGTRNSLDNLNLNAVPSQRTYTVEIRDMSICTLDTSGRRISMPTGLGFHGTVPKADQLYGCEDSTIALPILHDTLVRLQVTKYAPSQLVLQSPTSILLEDKKIFTPDYSGSLLSISGSVVNALRVSLTRAQYEQVLDTMQWLGKDDSSQPQQLQTIQTNGTVTATGTSTSTNTNTSTSQGPLAEITEEDVVGGVSTLSMDPHVRAKLFPSAIRRARINPNFSPNFPNSLDSQEPMRLSICFEVASFEVELCGEDGAGLIGLSFGDFLLTLRTPKIYETDLKVTLRSLLVEDLLANKGTLGRHMISSREETDYKLVAPPCVSRSCPGDEGNTIHQKHCRTAHYGSLPDRLDTKKMYGIIECNNQVTPLISNRLQLNQTNEKNLVTVTSKIIDASSPDFHTTYESMKKSTVVDLGSIDVVVSARSWIPLLDFFSFTNDNNNEDETNQKVSNTVVNQKRIGNSSTCVTIRSLTLQALCASSEEHSLARARVTDIRINSLREGEHRRINGRLEALHIRHSTPGNHVCFAERFVTIGNQALDFQYACPPISRKHSNTEEHEVEGTTHNNAYDSELTMEISPFVYVHTKRFVTELRAFFADFSRPRTQSNPIPTPNKIKKTPRRRSTIANEQNTNKTISRMSLKLSADACVMLMPVHSGCTDLLVLDVGQLRVSNVFTDAVEDENSSPLFDIQTWKLHDVDVYAAEAHARDILTMNTHKEPTLVFGDCAVLRRGGSLLTEKCLLEIRIDKNLMPNIRHRKNGVADMTMHCRLSTLDVTLDVHDYALIRGVLSHNLGEDTEHILPSVTVLETTTLPDDVWTLSSLRIELLDVRVRLRPLACVNFVRSRLTVDSFSDLSQDIDLVSRQILISDEREKTSNVFTEVLRPARKSGVANTDGSVQAEIHSRRRRDKSKFTVLLNNMRLMAIPDWWKAAGDFIFTQHQFNPGQQELEFDPYMSHQQQENQRIEQQNDVPYELKLNITDSEIVVVEDTSRPDTNAVILRSTTLLTYRPGVLTSTNVDGDTIKPLSFSVNHLELFSCRFQETERDTDEETALSIVDPVTVSADLSGTTLDVQLHELTVRVSYRDMLMFAAMLESISRQTVVASTTTQAYTDQSSNKTTKYIIDDDICKLCALGFTANDCAAALKTSNGRLDDAALWLTQNATPVQRAPPDVKSTKSGLDIRTIETRASCIRLCLIDDCGDVDVPLAEFGLSNLCASYELATLSTDPVLLEAVTISEENLVDHMPEFNGGSRAATVECTFALDYYNRVLGGWEPFVEPWRCRAVWRPEETISTLCPSRHRTALHSDDVLNINITDALLALSRLVHESWMKDTAPKTTPRNPFVPYSLKNDTGCVLYFATVITEPDEPFRPFDDIVDSDERLLKLSWTEVQPGDIVPFSYGSTRTKQRHKESHRMRAHQLAVRVHGWRTAAPVTVDRVGIYFRQAAPDRLVQSAYRVTALRSARLVFDVRLDGSARKLVTVRSALVLINRLPDAIDVKLVERSAVNAVSTSSRTALLASGETLPLPLVHAHSHIFIRPSDPNDSYSYSQPDVPWSRVTRPGERAHFSLRCTTNRGSAYYVCCEIRRERYPITTNCLANSIEQHIQGITMAIPAHSILLLPALLLVNLLPQDMYYNVTATCGDEPTGIVSKGRILPGRSAAVCSADPDASLEIAVHVENFRCSSGVTISSAITSNNTNNDTTIGINEYSCRIRLEDTERRRLFLRSRVEPGRGARVRVTVTAPYWIINRTGLPLVFRQEGVGAETAGQFEEHELARMVAPLLFSFADQDASPTVVARVGYKHGGSKIHGSKNPEWCQQFHLRRGVQVRRLRVSHDSAPSTVYVVGIEVRPARGRRRHQFTNIVTVSPRHQLHNRSMHTLEFAQACHATTVLDPAATAAHVHAPPGCHVPFHWPRLDRDQLLCVRCTDSNSENTATFRFPSSWSGGLRIASPLSCHVMLRDATTGIRTLFLHAEVVPHGATYCVVFSDAEALPPPLRVDNCSEVAVTFAQLHDGTLSSIGPPGTVAHAHRSVPYAWDEPTGYNKLVITAPGGVSAAYDVDQLGRGLQQLTYENFIYVAFTGTFNTEDDLDHYDEADYSSLVPSSCRRLKRPTASAPIIDPLRSQRLVLDVLEGSTIVVLAAKQPGKRSQLWRMTSTGQLQNEGSTAHEKAPLVLDIEAPAPQPSAPQPARLALRRPDPRRRTTQTWRFTVEGRLCCAHRNTCVQAQDGLMGLRPGSAAVLGPTSDAQAHRTHEIGAVPIEQAVGKQRMRPGSGLLAVELTTDGPTRVVRITDMKQREPLSARALADDEDWRGVALAHRPPSSTAPMNTNITTNINNTGYEIQLTIMLRAGLGISIIGGGRELVYLQLNNIIAEMVCGPRTRELCVSVQDAQCDNQLMDSNECPVLLHAARARNVTEARRSHSLPVLEIRAELQPAAGAVVIFKHLIVCMRSISVLLEEILLLRMYEFLLTAIGENTTVDDDDDNDDAVLFNNTESDDEESVTGAATLGTLTDGAVISTRYHFGIIRLVPGPIRLSVHTAGAGALPNRLRALKRRLGLTLVGFEDAPVELEPYVRHHPFETGAHLRRSVLSHFRDELLWQSAAILGSVDFLGSPLGLLGDVTEGVSGLIREKSVGALVLNVAHGLSNSAAKMTETLGDGLGRVTMDEAHEEMRQRIRRKHAGSGGEHLVAGIKGLGFGLLGGATGIFKQIYEGAANDGLQGVFSGLGKGLVGVVAKPVVGVLDLATETARAVRDSSRGTGRNVPERRRQPRAAIGPGGLLPPYSPRDSRGQAYLRTLCSSNSSSSSSSSSAMDRDVDGVGGNACGVEQYVAYECVRSGADDLRVIVSSERVRVVTAANSGSSSDSLTIVTETGLGELVCCMPVTQEGKHYIEMTVRGGSALRRPRIRCDTEELARTVTRQVNYAKRLHEEAAHTLHTQDDY